MFTKQRDARNFVWFSQFLYELIGGFFGFSFTESKILFKYFSSFYSEFKRYYIHFFCRKLGFDEKTLLFFLWSHRGISKIWNIPIFFLSIGYRNRQILCHLEGLIIIYVRIIYNNYLPLSFPTHYIHSINMKSMSLWIAQNK